MLHSHHLRILTTLIAAALFATASCARSAENETAVEDSVVSDNASKADTASRAEALLQGGPGSGEAYNIEEPYLNLIHAGAISWTNQFAQSPGDRLFTTADLYERGLIDEETGLLTALPDGAAIQTGTYFSGPSRAPWVGDWVLEWETEGDARADLKIQWLPDAQQRRAGAKRVEFSIRQANSHAAVRVTRLDAPLTALRLFRKENEAAARAGNIYNPRFVETARGYHIIRMMNLQETNRASIRDMSDQAGGDAAFWTNLGFDTSQNHPFQSMPLKAVFALGAEADAAIWHHAPITLGAPVELPAKDHDRVRAIARENAEAILASPAWDAYADAVVAALVATNYPLERPLYTTVSNEVWNFSGLYIHSTNYAWGLGEAFGQETGYGYGLAMARWAEALEGALSRAGRAQRVVYVVERQAANPWTTAQALRGMASRPLWSEVKDKVGVSVASYWGNGYQAWADNDAFLSALADDPQAAAKTWADFIIDGPANAVATKAWVLKQFAAHAAEAEKFGVRLIGAYEGGSHDVSPAYNGAQWVAPDEWFIDYHWGQEGARANRAVNDALAEAYPGVILSDYILGGYKNPSYPWNEGPLGEPNPMRESWDAYKRAEPGP